MIMRRLLRLAIYLFAAAPAISLAASAPPRQANADAIEQMPAKLETEFALSALPPAMRPHASVYLLDPQKGYQLSHRGTSGVTCLVERTAWERTEFRNDIYVPLCYDAAGTRTFQKVIRDVARLRIRGISPAALKAEIEKRYKNKTYTVPERTGISYMVAPVMRTWMLPDWQVHTGPMPHLMFYAPHVTDIDVGTAADSGLAYPFIFKEGLAEQSYIIHVMGEAEIAKIIAQEQRLLADLCAYRDVLCVARH
jgi:hypothetical protein